MPGRHRRLWAGAEGLHRAAAQFPLLAVAGNHDWAATGQIDANDFNGYARAAIIWTAEQLTAEECAFLSGLPEVAESGPFTLVHGSLLEPLREYLFTPEDTLDTFDALDTAYCLVGHTHYPAVFRESGGPAGEELPEWERPPHRWRTPLAGPRCIINPGSVGQPRDHDSRAAYAVYDDGADGGARLSNTAAWPTTLPPRRRRCAAPGCRNF